jgi:translocator protein
MNPVADPFSPPVRRPRRGRNLAVSSALVAAAAGAGSLATEPEGRWYATLDKPDWQPPSVAFPVVWTTLYASIAATSAAVLNELDRRGDAEEAAQYRTALATNLALNGAWSWVFFRAHNLPASTLGAAALAANSIGLARRAGRVRRRFGLALAPYALWTSFATVLSAVVWRRNPDRSGG